MLKFCLTVDCERLIMFKQGNPEYNRFQRMKFFVNNLIKNFRYNKNGFELFYKEIKNNEFPCTFMLTGGLFKPLEDFNFVEWGYHTYNHLPLTLLSNERVEREVENIYDLKSITCPMWRIEEVKNPSRIFNILKKQGYENTVYHGVNEGVKSVFKKSVRNPEVRFGIKCVHVSNYFEGNWSKKRIKNVKEDILKNLDKEGIYLLTTHDFTHKNTQNLRSILKFIRKLEMNKKIKPINLSNS